MPAAVTSCAREQIILGFLLRAGGRGWGGDHAANPDPEAGEGNPAWQGGVDPEERRSSRIWQWLVLRCPVHTQGETRRVG